VIVADAAAIVDLALGSQAALDRLRDDELSAPHLLDAEVGSALRRNVLQQKINSDQFREALAALRDLEVERYPHLAFLDRAWELRDNVTFYDAMYVALAEALNITLVTLDGRLHKAPGLRCPVEVIEPGGE
jgi:predicted nucleic acid-binding protein